jgi:hypothetical protein
MISVLHQRPLARSLLTFFYIAKPSLFQNRSQL